MKPILFISSLLFIILGTAGCKDKEEALPFDENSKIKNIKVPAFSVNNSDEVQLAGYNVMHIAYNQDKIQYIINRQEIGGKSEFRDSTHFYYVDEKLDHALRIEKGAYMGGYT